MQALAISLSAFAQSAVTNGAVTDLSCPEFAAHPANPSATTQIAHTVLWRDSRHHRSATVAFDLKGWQSSRGLQEDFRVVLDTDSTVSRAE
jgi:hypothetical protein